MAEIQCTEQGVLFTPAKQSALQYATLLISDELSERWETDHGLCVPWEWALYAADLIEAEDDEERLSDLQQARPTWIDNDDEEALIQTVACADLPKRTPYLLEVAAVGNTGKPGFKLAAKWRKERNGRLRQLRDEPEIMGGLVFQEGEQRRRLSFGQYRALRELAEPQSDSVDANQPQRAKDLLRKQSFRAAVPQSDPGIRWDSVLEDQNVVRIDRIQPRLVPTDGGYQVRPQIAGFSTDSVDHYFDHTPHEQQLATVLVEAGAGAKKIRGVMTPTAVQGLAKLRSLGVLTKEQTAAALSDPQAFFGSAIDCSRFSDRVIGIGPVVMHLVPDETGVQKQDWFNHTLRDSEGADLRDGISLADPQTLRELLKAIADADERGETVIPNPAGTGFLEVNPALRSAVARAQRFTFPDAHADGEEDKAEHKDVRAELVLQVEQNVEEVLYDRSSVPGAIHEQMIPPPPGLVEDKSLHPYQTEGYRWLAKLYLAGRDSHTWGGALLADDMGVGKTIQVLSFLSWLKTQPEQGPFLVVAPVGLLKNWEQESYHFFGDRFEPILSIRGRDLPKDRALARQRLEKQGLVLTSYETLRQNEFVFASVQWGAAVLDEAQKTKNITTQVARVVRALNARFRLALSGTPVENDLKELWCLYDWAKPGLLGDIRSFTRDYVKPLESENEDIRRELATGLHKRLEMVFMRRLKRDVCIDLPEKRIEPIEVPLNEEQVERYDFYLSQLRAGGKPLTVLDGLFKCCAHPQLYQGADLPTLEEYPYPRGVALLRILERIRQQSEKVLIFSKWRKIQSWIAREMKLRFGIEVAIINGALNSSEKRLAVIKQFEEQKGFGVLVLGPRAAGVGLNITAANHVIHFNREWNPAIEQQATDRAYRIGQKKPVYVHPFIAVRPDLVSVEQNLDRLLNAKQKLMNDFVIPMGGFDVTAAELL